MKTQNEFWKKQKQVSSEKINSDIMSLVSNDCWNLNQLKIVNSSLEKFDMTTNKIDVTEMKKLCIKKDKITTNDYLKIGLVIVLSICMYIFLAHLVKNTNPGNEGVEDLFFIIITYASMCLGLLWSEYFLFIPTGILKKKINDQVYRINRKLTSFSIQETKKIELSMTNTQFGTYVTSLMFISIIITVIIVFTFS